MTRGVVRLLIPALASALGAFGGAARAQQAGPGGEAVPAGLELVEAGVPELRRALETGELSAERLLRGYLARVEAYDDQGPALNSVLQLDGSALEQARESDRRRAAGAIRGPLDGIPVLLKDNIDAAGLPTTAGSLALEGSLPPDDAFLVRRLREAGAVILGKATLTEFANFLTDGMPNGFSSLGGFGFNPYDPRPLPGGDGRPVLDPGGSSSGSAIGVSASLVSVAVGTETSGSILSPASANGVVGIKPTVGLVSRDGVIPISAAQDTAGPIARTVTDAALLLGALVGFDPADPATEVCREDGARCPVDYTPFLDAGALEGARIAVPPFPLDRAPILGAAMEALREAGATVVRVEGLPVQRPICARAPADPGCSTVFLFEFKRGLDAYLSATPDAPIRSLAELVAFNARTPEARVYGQTLARAAQALDTTPGSRDERRFEADRAADVRGSRGPLDALYRGPDERPGTADDFDAILVSENFGAGIAARAGYPSITVPGGFLGLRGWGREPQPSGVTFSGPPFSEPRLIALAYAFEQATRLRRPPRSAPPLSVQMAEAP